MIYILAIIATCTALAALFIRQQRHLRTARRRIVELERRNIVLIRTAAIAVDANHNLQATIIRLRRRRPIKFTTITPPTIYRN